MIWIIAWKNIWRNKLRSSIVILAFTLGIFAAVFAAASMIGMIEQRIKAAIRTETANIQLHHPKFKDNNDIKCYIDNFPAVITSILKIEGIKAISSRLLIQGMANTAANSAGVMVCGVQPNEEIKVSELYKCFPPRGGKYLSENNPNEIVLGEKLAKELQLTYYLIDDSVISLLNNKFPQKHLLDSLKNIKFRSEKDLDNKIKKHWNKPLSQYYLHKLKTNSLHYNLRNKIILTFQTPNGDITGAAFRVCGIYKTKNAMFDAMNVFVNKKTLLELSGVPSDKCHEIAILTEDKIIEADIIKIIQKQFPSLLTEDWREIQPDAGYMAEMSNFMITIYLIIILLALCFGIINTMLMVVLERTRELGMLKAVGMNNRRVFSMLMLETVMLCLVGTILGMLLSYFVILYTSRTGIDLSWLYGKGFEQWGFDAFFYPKISLSDFIQTTILVIITGIISSIVPARKALKLNPINAIRQ
ncbi:MAG: ABC transporter permease [Bacteroidales bacterium]|nr:ABC transporter permease [Bacteroidales bacterium]